MEDVLIYNRETESQLTPDENKKDQLYIPCVRYHCFPTSLDHLCSRQSLAWAASNHIPIECNQCLSDILLVQ